ncbi:FixH family protein [Paenibacillus sp. NPDC057967]|uniref:FixH family protein n=1 Tax=Paenibacillus sp. NPDC057967 TaxID=3346293 RepID=UPI0036DF8720
MSNRNNWRNIGFSTLLAAMLLLSACTANVDSVDENGLQPHLKVDLHIPEKLVLHENNSFSVQVMKDGQPAAADQIHFQFWPEGKSEQAVTLDGNKIDEGVYAVDYRLMEQGIYVVRCFIASDSLEVMPAKRFAIGSEAVLHLAALEEQEAQGSLSQSNQAAGGHHHH